MARKFVDTPEAGAKARSPILEENDRLHRRNSILFGIVVYTYVVLVLFGVAFGIKQI
jgi:hypothetical protein